MKAQLNHSPSDYEDLIISRLNGLDVIYSSPLSEKRRSRTLWKQQISRGFRYGWYGRLPWAPIQRGSRISVWRKRNLRCYGFLLSLMSLCFCNCLKPVNLCHVQPLSTEEAPERCGGVVSPKLSGRMEEEGGGRGEIYFIKYFENQSYYEIL